MDDHIKEVMKTVTRGSWQPHSHRHEAEKLLYIRSGILVPEMVLPADTVTPFKKLGR